MAETIVIIAALAIGIFILYRLCVKIDNTAEEEDQTRRFMEDEMFLRYNEFETYCAMLRKAVLSDDFNPEDKK